MVQTGSMTPLDDGADEQHDPLREGECGERRRGSKKGGRGDRDGEAVLPSPALYTSPEPAAAVGGSEYRSLRHCEGPPS